MNIRPGTFFPSLSSLLVVLIAGCGGQGVGTVAATSNPLVAAYTVSLSEPAQVAVEFGKDTTYGYMTSSQSAAALVPLTIQVAGMQQNTTYHMRAVITEADGTKVLGDDRIFKTGSIPAGYIPTLTAQTTAGTTPQPGIEMLNPVLGSATSSAFAVDLQGNPIWYYPFPDHVANSILYPIKLLPNGHLACMLSLNPESTSTAPLPDAVNSLREIDLAGNTIQNLTMATLNTRMAAAGFNVNLLLFSHDFELLPNGHWLIIATTAKNFTNLPGYPGNLNVTGDVVVDLDENMNPVWYWNSFDHLDINRHPFMFPDWTHSNSIDYSKDDGNFIISMRHQNWVLKIDYRDGAGTGNVLWHLGEGGDFKLINGVDPTDWFYAQHYATFISPNTTGIFTLGVMDNGDDRMFAPGIDCGLSTSNCFYTTIPLMQINEQAMTATLTFHQVLPPNLYSFFAGNAEVLANNNVEYELAGVGTESYVFEVTHTANPATVWQLHLASSNSYRGLRMPSLYPGVQW